jgi:hypothetical protein
VQKSVHDGVITCHAIVLLHIAQRFSNSQYSVQSTDLIARFWNFKNENALALTIKGNKTESVKLLTIYQLYYFRLFLIPLC